MKTKVLFRNGIGFDLIMGMMLLVLPALAFIVMLLSEYTAIMHIDNKLKLITNMLSRFAAQQENVRDWSIYTPVLAQASKLCPQGTTLVVDSTGDATNPREIDISVSYHFQGNYFDQTINERLITYSYHDQNLTAALTCK